MADNNVKSGVSSVSGQEEEIKAYIETEISRLEKVMFLKFLLKVVSVRW
jgi:hypothetical protein